jgi:hypothetical protein
MSHQPPKQHKKKAQHTAKEKKSIKQQKNTQATSCPSSSTEPSTRRMLSCGYPHRPLRCLPSAASFAAWLSSQAAS